MTTADRIADLSTIWRQVTMVFPYFDRCHFEWDALYREYLERVLTTEDERQFHLLLAEFMARLGDGHTMYGFPRSLVAQVGSLPFALRYCADGYYISEIEEASARYLLGKVESINGRPFEEILQEAFRYSYHVGDYAYPSHLKSILPFLLKKQGNEMVTSKGVYTFELCQAREAMKMVTAPTLTVSQEYRQIPSEKLDIRVYHDLTAAKDILYIKLPNFLYARAAQEVAAAIQNTSHASGIILDLRENIGGMTKFGAYVAELFMSGERHGCQKRTRRMRGIDIACASQFLSMSQEEIEENIANGLGTREAVEHSLRVAKNLLFEEYEDSFGASGHQALTDLPCVILTSRDTISAAEDFVAMFRSNHRAAIMGAPTCGTTGTPLLQPLACGGYVRICSVAYRLLDGTEFVGVGIQPDVSVETRLSDIEAGTDTVLARAIQHLTDLKPC